MGLFDGFLSAVRAVSGEGGLLDSVWTDDFGGNVITPITNALGQNQAVQALTRATDTASAATTWAVSALPGGARTASWSEAQQISPGQMVLGGGGPLALGGFDALTRAAIAWGPPEVRQRAQDTLRYTSPKFDVYNPAQRAQAFSDSLAGKMASGAVDAAFSWFLDPSVVAGKTLKVVRFGSDVLKTGGLTQRSLNTPEAIQRFASEIDEHVAWRTSGGMIGRRTAAGEAVERTVSMDRAAVFDDPLAKFSTNRNMVADLLGESDDLEFSALLVKAGAGHVDSMYQLRLQSASTADAFDLIHGIDPADADAFNVAIGQLDAAGIYSPPPNVAARYDAVFDDLKARDGFLQSALSMADEAGVIRGGMVADMRVPGTSYSIGARVESARTGAQQRLHEARMDPAGRGMNQRLFQRNPYVRPVRVFTWATGQRPAGWVYVKGVNAQDSGIEVFSSLSEVRAFNKTPELVAFKNRAFNAYLAADTTEKRVLVLASIERTASRRICQAYGISREVADEIYDSYSVARMSLRDSIRSKGYAVDANGEMVTVPQWSSQLDDAVPMMDFRLYEKLIKRHQNALRATVGRGSDMTKAVVEPLQTAWRASVLIRGGYPVRNTLEGNLRAWAAIGFLPAFAEPTKVMRNMVANNAWRARTGYNYAADLVTHRNPKYLADRAELLKSQLDVLGTQYDEAMRLGDQRMVQEVIAQADEVQAALDDVSVRLDAAADRLRNRGTRVKRGDDMAFSGPQGGVLRAMSSADFTYENVMFDMLSRHAQSLQQSHKWTRIDPGDRFYWDELANTSNRIFRNDPVASRILNGASDDEIATWLRSQDGRFYRREMDIDRDEVLERVARSRELVARYLPTPEVRLAVSQGEVSANYLRGKLATFDELSPIHGRELSEAALSRVVRAPRSLTKGLYKVLGTLPENVLVRHPFFNKVYTTEYTRLIKAARAQGGVVDEVRIRRVAANFAQRETKKTLYTIERYSNPAALLRWVMPFFAAWENTTKTWLRIAYRDPSVVARASMVWNLPNELGMVVDEHGDPVPPGAPWSQSQFIILPPAFNDLVAKYSGGRMFDAPKHSLNVVLQGETPFLPGFGPAITAPTAALLRMKPELEEVLTEVLGESVYKTLVPFGRPQDEATDQLLAPWMQKAKVLYEGEANDEFMSSVVGIWMDMYQKWQDEGSVGEMPTSEQAIKNAREFWKMRVAANLTLPFGPRWRSPYQFYIDKYRKYVEELGYMEGEKQFAKEFPDYLIFMESLSENNTNMSPDQAAYANYRKYTSLWNRVAEIDPKLAFLVTNPQGERGEYSPAVWQWQRGTPVLPGSDQTIRDAQSIAEFQEKYFVSQGWQEYLKARGQIDNELAMRGFTSMRQKGAEYIRDVWGQWLTQLAERNPRWYNDYNDRDTDARINRTIQGFRMVVDDEQFMADNGDKPVWTLVKDYLENRELIVETLRQNAAAGGSADINAESNEYVLNAWEQYTSRLVASDIDFADLYARYFERDHLRMVPQYAGSR